LWSYIPAFKVKIALDFKALLIRYYNIIPIDSNGKSAMRFFKRFAEHHYIFCDEMKHVSKAVPAK